jgi:predicted exporter
MGSLDRIAARIGLVDRVVARARADLATTAPLTLPDWLGRPASAPFRHLWLGPIEGTDTVASIVLLRGSPDPAALTALPLPEGVQLLDPVSDISGVFAAVRGRAAWLILGSYLVVATVLMLRYGPAGGIRVFAVPLAAGCVCVAFFGLSGGVSLFHQMALLLVLGMGVDYGLFFREAGQAERRSTLIAVAMSALTTVLAFGLLAFSDTMAISAFGQTVAIGIVTAFLVSPFLKRSERPAQYVMESTDVG